MGSNESEGGIMYEPSRHIATYYMAGVQHWHGALTARELEPNGLQQRTNVEQRRENAR